MTISLSTFASSFACLVLLVVSVRSYAPHYASNARTNAQVDALKADRRGFLVASSAALGTIMINPSQAMAVDELEDYRDEDCNFSIKVPKGWERSVQSLPDRRKIVLYIKPNSDQKTLVFFAYTPVRADFTSLGSFGSVDEVAQATILPKSTLAGVEGVSSQMLSATSNKQAYFFDYITKVPQQPETHFRTIFSLAMGAASGSNVLVSITAQTPQDKYDELKPLFDQIIESYK